MNFLKSYNPFYLFRKGFYVRYLELARYIGFIFPTLDILYAKAQVGIIEKGSNVALKLREKRLIFAPTHAQIRRLARFYPRECLDYWLENGVWDPALIAISRKLETNLPPSIARRCLDSQNLDKILLVQSWHGLNEYFTKHGLLPVASEVPWMFTKREGINLRVEGPKVSVLMTCFNAEKTVDVAVQSIIEQTYSNIQLLIIDDASTDGTYEKLKNIKIKYPEKNLLILKNSCNCGTYASKTKLLKFIDRDAFYLTCMDSDDWSHPQKIEYQVKNLIANPDQVANISYWIRFNRNGFPSSLRIYPYLSLNYSSLMMRLDGVGSLRRLWDTSVRFGADQELVLRIEEKFGDRAIAFIKLPLTIGYCRKGSLTTDPRTSSETKQGRRLRAFYIHQSFFEIRNRSE